MPISASIELLGVSMPDHNAIDSHENPTQGLKIHCRVTVGGRRDDSSFDDVTLRLQGVLEWSINVDILIIVTLGVIKSEIGPISGVQKVSRVPWSKLPSRSTTTDYRCLSDRELVSFSQFSILKDRHLMGSFRRCTAQSYS